MTTTVYLLRHGATAANRRTPYRLQGRDSDGALDELGIAQARLAAETLRVVDLAAVYTSPLRRALETARIVAQPHGCGAVVVPEVTEAALGRWEGLTWDEARALDPEHYVRFMAEPGTVPYPGGESFQNVQERVTPVLCRLAADHPDQAIAVVGHNVVNRAYLASVLGLPINRARAIRQANGGFNVIRYDGRVPELISMNACLHLRDLDGLAASRTPRDGGD